MSEKPNKPARQLNAKADIIRAAPKLAATLITIAHDDLPEPIRVTDLPNGVETVQGTFLALPYLYDLSGNFLEVDRHGLDDVMAETIYSFAGNSTVTVEVCSEWPNGFSLAGPTTLNVVKIEPVGSRIRIYFGASGDE